ncbi:arsenate reductase (glutaredoxin) [Sulfitobacter sp. S190]|uniref:arsenate reductase (glutaredoxin) n=1 Tax=Sulfitobacter sp. S190 TaxID=2867022 RepID=UPI0021A70A99|nr:arsenate reductase (glutaredoxin) [Sulfitobacter sp. S190]UWR23215.1 arsenate reductase (glutaredoxin) [Sulfitobacter sp. S190]
MITIWHNPRCSKSRQTLALIEASGLPYTQRRYLDDPPTADELRAVRARLDIPLIDILRPSEAAFRAAGLDAAAPEAALIALATAHPIVIERPIVIRGDRAVIGRPPENVSALL